MLKKLRAKFKKIYAREKSGSSGVSYLKLTLSQPVLI